MEKEVARVHRIFDILHGKQVADLLIANVQVLDVFGETLFHGSLLIDEGVIIALNPDRSIIQVQSIFDGQGLTAIPGLIDAHFHYESQLANPAALAEVMTPRGTTSCFVEILDFISAAGDEGVRAAEELFKQHECLPYRLYAFAPGKKVPFQITKDILQMEPVIGLGEFDTLSYGEGNEEDFLKAAYARELGLCFNGHWGITQLTELELNYLPAIGVTNNHDVWNGEDIERSLRYGFDTQIKFGVGNVCDLLRAVVERKFCTEHLQLCSDNVSVNHMREKGHMDFIVNLAIEMGVPPIQAIKMATYNIARHFHMDGKIGSLAPGRFADLVLTENLSSIQPKYVFKGGKLVAQEGRLLDKVNLSYSHLCREGVRGCDDLQLRDFDICPIEVAPGGDRAKVHLFSFSVGYDRFDQEIWLPLKEGQVVGQINEKDLTRISIIERYNGSSIRNVINGFFEGINLDQGAIAVSFPAPKPYILVVGKDPKEMLFSVRQVERYSGACVVTQAGIEEATLPLEIYGMMADMGLEELLIRIAEVDVAVGKLGYSPEGEPVIYRLLGLFYPLHRFGFIH